MNERPIPNASMPHSSDEMAWSYQHQERPAVGEDLGATATRRVVDSQLLPIPAKATGIVFIRAFDFVTSIAGSIRESMARQG